MDAEVRQKNLRKKLDVLGFRQPLPVSGVGLVSALLDDLLKTTESLKLAKQEINQLVQEKSAWELGVEPYKCDNSKLLGECNKLNQDIIRQGDHYELKKTEFVRRIRTLEMDKRYLEEQCGELAGRVRELEVKFVTKGDAKFHKDGVNLSKKPFISTVRSGILLPTADGHVCDKGSYRGCSGCPNSRGCDGNRFEAEKLQNDVENREETIQVLKKQIEARDREIERLTGLLSGGRPVTSLARDCCFRGVGSMAEDVEILQKQKCDLRRELNEAISAQHEAMQRAMRLAERNSSVEKEYKELEKTALELEAKANRTVREKEHENSDLKRRVSDLLDTIKGLRMDVERLQVGEVTDSVREKLVQALKKEKSLQRTIEKLQSKNARLKGKLSEPRSLDSTRDDALERELSLTKLELVSLRKEFSTLEGKCRNNSEVRDLKIKLSEKELEIRNLHHELNQLRQGEISSARSLGQSSAILRQERDRDVMRSDLEKVRIERDALRDRLKMATEVQLDEQRRYEGLLEEINGRIGRLEAEKTELLSVQGPTKITVTLLKEELKELRDRLKELQADNSALRSSNNHLKILNEQTERVLVQNHNKLVHSEAQLGETSSKLNSLDTTREQLRQELEVLKPQIHQLRSSEIQLQNEKDNLVIELDQKTEKTFNLEQEMKHLRAEKRDLEAVVEQLRRRLDELRSDGEQRSKQFHDVACETGSLRSQVATLKRNADTARSENGRLVGELTDASTELKITRQRLKETQKEVDGLRLQLKQYVQEVERAENLLTKKELEREEMLDHFKSLSQDTIVLEGNKHALEMMTAETKKALTESEDRVSTLVDQLKLRESEIQDYEKQVTVLSSQVASLEADLEDCQEDKRKLQTDLEAVRELCSKLDDQKDKLNEEVEELTSIRGDLEKNLERLRSDAGRKIVEGEESRSPLERDFDQQKLLIANLNQELSHLRGKVAQLEMELKDEHRVSVKNEHLAQEYHTQLQEARQTLTNERYERAKLHEDTDSVRKGKCLKFHFTVRGKDFWVRPARRRRSGGKSSDESSNSILTGHSAVCWDQEAPQDIDVSQRISIKSPKRD